MAVVAYDSGLKLSKNIAGAHPMEYTSTVNYLDSNFGVQGKN